MRVIWFLPMLQLVACYLKADIGVEVISRPCYKDYGKFARWMLKTGDWGIISTSGKSWNGSHGSSAPFGNVVSYADSNGIPIFYLSKMDPTGQDLVSNPSASLSISEKSFKSGCHSIAEEPICGRLTLSGNVTVVPEQDPRYHDYLSIILSKHAEMRMWPKSHDFQIYTLDIQNIYLVDFFGGAPDVTLEDYFANRQSRVILD